MTLDRKLRATRGRLVPALLCLLSVTAVVVVAELQVRAKVSRDQQIQVARIEATLLRLQGDPFEATESSGGSPLLARRLIARHEGAITRRLASLQASNPVAELRAAERAVRKTFALVDEIYAATARSKTIAATGPQLDQMIRPMNARFGAASAALSRAEDAYRRRAAAAHAQTILGTGAAVVLLLTACLLAYRGAFRARRVAERYAQANGELLRTSQREALRDSLTGLGNRRALVRALNEHTLRATADAPLHVALLDLDGFKQYNDTFGHPAGDALLRRLGHRLRQALEGAGTAYRLGGDEFCVLSTTSATPQELGVCAADALSEHGDGFVVGCSFGALAVPVDASTPDDALRLADLRLYEQKSGRSSAARQGRDLLLQVLTERGLGVHRHLEGVARLAADTAKQLGLPEHEVKLITLAAELHDVGKAAVPDGILRKPGPLTEAEWDFVRNHTLIGERILRAAPALAPCAPLVRSSHERIDGRGYPDGLAGHDIPLGSRIIAICDAYDAMTSGRGQSGRRNPSEARAELLRCAGTQFDHEIVATFCRVTTDQTLLAT